jgi:N6-L-threonylcarbamoyladenine synthase
MTTDEVTSYPNAIRFPAMADSGNYDFSLSGLLSGLKTAVLWHVRAEREAGREVDPADLADSFGEDVVDARVSKAVQTTGDRGVGTVLLSGGVVANTCLRKTLEKAGAEAGLIPSRDLGMDNGAMIALARAGRPRRGDPAPLRIGADPSLELG